MNTRARSHHIPCALPCTVCMHKQNIRSSAPSIRQHRQFRSHQPNVGQLEPTMLAYFQFEFFFFCFCFRTACATNERQLIILTAGKSDAILRTTVSIENGRFEKVSRKKGNEFSVMPIPNGIGLFQHHSWLCAP